MDQGNPTTEYISNLISAVCPNAQLRIFPDYGFLVKTDDSAVEVRFGRAKIDDFAIALERYRNTNYFFTLENHIKFRIYLALGSEGLLDELVISRELINEKGDWLQNIQVDVSFEEEFARTLYEGLKLLDESLTALISRTNVQVPELERDAENIRYLIRYYEENGHLSSRDAKLESLSYLKGGAICSIATIEREKQQCRIARLRKAFDRKIYAIVADLRDDPFQRIPVPECAREFITQQNETNHHFSRIPEMEAFRPISSDRIDELLDVLDNRLRNRRSGAWQTLNSDNPDRLSQAANSMVELLDQVIGQVCGSVTLNEFLERKFGGREETRWVHATRNWISETKSNLHRIKHHTDFQSEKLTEALMRSAESIILLILE